MFGRIAATRQYNTGGGAGQAPLLKTAVLGGLGGCVRKNFSMVKLFSSQIYFLAATEDFRFLLFLSSEFFFAAAAVAT